MPVEHVNVGPKRVHLTAYCPDDALGMLACQFVLERAKELGATPEEFERWIREEVPDGPELLALLAAGYELPKGPPASVDPTNVRAELRILGALQKEMEEQQR